MSSVPAKWIEVNRLLAVSGGLSILASAILAVAFFIYVPVAGDGAWYSYPAYAWSQGGDPSENLPGLERPSPPPGRPIAVFGWENRSNLTVLLTAGWFKVFAPSWESIKVFGALQFILLVALVGFCVFQVTASTALALFASCLAAADSRVIAETMADARPDTFIAVASVALLSLLLLLFRPTTRPTTRRWMLPAVVVLAVALPLLHITAAYAVSFMIAFLGLRSLLVRKDDGATARLRIAALVTLLLVFAFLLRQLIIDAAVPTAVPISVEYPFRHHLAQEIHSIVSGSFADKLRMEIKRWSDYFFFANAAHFSFIALGASVALWIGWRRSRGTTVDTALSLAGGVLVAVVAMVLTDTHPMAQHLLVVAVLAYVAACAVLGSLEKMAILSTPQLIRVCCTILVLGAVLNAVHAVSLYRQYAAFNVSNATEKSAILAALPATGDVKVIGPSEIWPFLASRKAPLLLEDHDRAVFLDNGGRFALDAMPNYSGAQYLVVNSEYLGFYRWSEAVAEWTRKGLIAEVAHLGNCERTVQCLRIFAINPQETDRR